MTSLSVKGVLRGTALFLFVLRLASVAQTNAQAGFTGTWQASGAPPQTTWTVVLRTQGSRVVGAVSECASFGPVEISDGRIAGDTVRFKCQNPIGTRSITLTGQLKVDQIDFDAEIETLTGPGVQAPIPSGRFAASEAKQFTARRVPDVKNAVSDIANAARRAPDVSFERVLQFFLELLVDTFQLLVQREQLRML